MRRLFFVGLALACLAASLGAQDRFRPRFGTVGAQTPNTAPTIAITEPTASATLSTTAAAIPVGGQATDDRGVASVAWACAACTPTSGTATGTTNWSIASIGLAVGANTITVTATDTNAATTADVIVVTREATDTESPSAQITSPTANPTDSVVSAAYTLGGTALDNVAVTSVTWTCGGCTPSSGTATGTTSWTFSLTLGVGGNGITVTPHDLAGNLGVTDTIVVTYTPGDETDPTVTITAPTSSATYTAPASTITLGGTASDTGGSGLDVVTWINASGGSGTADGTTNWSVLGLPLSEGTNVITVTAKDIAGNTSTDAITVTWVADLVITTTVLSAVTRGTAYTGQLFSSGGTGAKTWTNNGAGTTLNDGDADCAPLAISTSGAVTGLVTAGDGTDTCTWTALVTDSAGTPDTDTQAFSLTIQDAGVGSGAYYTSMTGRGDAWAGKSYDIRSQATIDANSGGGSNAYVTYDAGLNAAEFVIPPFYQPTNGGTATTLNSTMDTSATFWGCTQAVVPGYACFTIATANSQALLNQDGKWWRIGSEIMITVDPDGNGPRLSYTDATKEVVVTRAVNSTSIAAHSIGAAVEIWTNKLEQQVRLPLDTTDAYTYVFSWDYKVSNSYMGASFGQQKTFQFTCWIATSTHRLCIEPQIMFAKPDGTLGNGNQTCSDPGYNPLTDAGAFKQRSNLNIDGTATWADTTGKQMGPLVTDIQPLCPQASEYVWKPDVWNRIVMRMEQRANDYDHMTMWVGDENRDLVKVFDDVLYSLDLVANPITKRGIGDFWYELDTSQETQTPNRTDLHDFVSYGRWLISLRQAGLIGAGTLDDATLLSSGVLARPLP